MSFHKNRHLKRNVILSAAAFLLTACADFSGIQSSARRIDSNGLLALTVPAGIKQARHAWPIDSWWGAYQNPQLDRLIQYALLKNPTLAAAQARIMRAQSVMELNSASIGLQAGVSADASYGRQSGNYIMPRPPIGHGGTYIDQERVAVDFRHELDLWGKNAALISAAEAQVSAATFDRDAARLALTTAIARTYAQLAMHYDLQDVLFAMQKQRDTIRTLTQRRLTSGLDTRIELRQSETSVAALRIDLIQLETAIKVTRLQLAALTGAMPASADNIARPALTAVPFTVPQDLPLDFLGRRPELAAQRARISAATGDAHAAKARFYPNISLTGFAGFQSIGIEKLLTAGSFVNGIGPAVHLPIFDNRRLRANYAGKTADIDVAITQYNQSVVSAAQDVAEQLTRIASLTREEQATHEALAAAEDAYRIAMLRYRGKLSSYLSVLAVETQLLVQRRAAVSLKAKRHDLHIALVRALGGGFVEHSPASTKNDAQQNEQ